PPPAALLPPAPVPPPAAAPPAAPERSPPAVALLAPPITSPVSGLKRAPLRPEARCTPDFWPHAAKTRAPSSIAMTAGFFMWIPPCSSHLLASLALPLEGAQDAPLAFGFWLAQFAQAQGAGSNECDDGGDSQIEAPRGRPMGAPDGANAGWGSSTRGPSRPSGPCRGRCHRRAARQVGPRCVGRERHGRRRLPRRRALHARGLGFRRAGRRRGDAPGHGRRLGPLRPEPHDLIGL